ncbi:hypothetical protein [Blastopirellula retiformator]|uniref:Uncharacterized protein n=1 Tax=Blastopirellula retiformator TaxID=2527970 RepID=A0A5C5VAD6_9BACT|nr:hypothetical protein [Blastopirellula retiformator]TWT34605.1 hypothetical protein Enr8_20180 [Blastopirellula retiformator]
MTKGPRRDVAVEVVVDRERCANNLIVAGEPLRIHFAGVRVEVPPGFDRATLAMTWELLRGSAC